MKNIQVIDGADNCTYTIYRVSDEKFEIVFPNGQDIEFFDDLKARLSAKQLEALFDGFWDDFLNKKDVIGIHGTLFYELEFKKQFYPTKKDDEMIGF